MSEWKQDGGSSILVKARKDEGGLQFKCHLPREAFPDLLNQASA